MAKSLENCLPVLERIEKLIASYNYRRDAAIRELDKRRDVLARRAREFAESLALEAEVITVAEDE